MDEMPGMIRPDLQALPQVKDRMTFLYGKCSAPDFSPHMRGKDPVLHLRQCLQIRPDHARHLVHLSFLRA